MNLVRSMTKQFGSETSSRSGHSAIGKVADAGLGCRSLSQQTVMEAEHS